MAIEPIKGFYVHDEVTNTDGVARYSADSLDNLDETVSLAGYAPDAKAVGDRLAKMEKDLAQGNATLNVFEWTNGDTWIPSGQTEIVISAGYTYRICNSKPFSFPIDLTLSSTTLNIKTYRYENGAWVLYNWTGEQTIPANTPVYVTLTRRVQDTSEIADITEFLSLVSVSRIVPTYAEYIDAKTVTGAIIDGNFSPAMPSAIDTGHYVVGNGNVSPLAKYSIYKYALDKNDIITVVTSKGITDANLALISKWNEGNFEKTIVFSQGDGLPTSNTYIATEPCEIWVTEINNNTSYKYTVTTAKLNNGFSDYIGREETTGNCDFNVLSAFDNITCIGDSLTVSQVYTGSSTSRLAYVPYPEVIARKTGSTSHTIGHAGASAKTCWSQHNEEIVQRDNNLTIVYLGTNEGLTDTVATDCAGNDYSTYADTNTGRYGCIVKKSIDLGSRVVLIKVHSSSGNIATTKKVIEDFAEKFGVPVIDNEYLGGARFHSYPDGSGTNGTHYNDLGYSAFADMVIHNISNLSSGDLVKIIPE